MNPRRRIAKRRETRIWQDRNVGNEGKKRVTRRRQLLAVHCLVAFIVLVCILDFATCVSFEWEETTWQARFAEHEEGMVLWYMWPAMQRHHTRDGCL